MKLADIAEVRSGLVLARKKASLDYDIKENYRLISLKNIDDDGALNEEAFESFASNDRLNEEYFTQEGDILIRLSAPYTAISIDKRTAGLLVPSYFSIIKLKSKDYLSEYISWYLNSDKVKRELIRSQTGTAIATTNTKILSSINIKALPMDEQIKIAKIRELYLRERELLNKLIKEKERFYKGITKELINRK